MPKKDRHDISVRGSTYERVKIHCERKGISPSEEISRLIDEHLDAVQGTPEEIEAKRREHFTF